MLACTACSMFCKELYIRTHNSYSVTIFMPLCDFSFTVLISSYVLVGGTTCSHANSFMLLLALKFECKKGLCNLLNQKKRISEKSYQSSNFRCT